ncbi:MAG TPA: hypothetical protein DIV41_01090, partial [Ruminococcaceae bacterium]|nr:hypothetical protein [Oscillospiraceae bacterium]
TEGKWTYHYVVGNDVTKASTTDDAVILAEGIDLTSVTDGQKVAVTAFDNSGTEKGTVVVTVKV